MMGSQKVKKTVFPSFRRKPESSKISPLKFFWTPVFTGVTTFHESIKNGKLKFRNIAP